MRILGPKWVKRANSWCVTVFKEIASGNTKKQHSGQSISWFTTKEEAETFIKQQQSAE
jgi:hypothetical protein